METFTFHYFFFYKCDLFLLGYNEIDKKTKSNYGVSLQTWSHESLNTLFSNVASNHQLQTFHSSDPLADKINRWNIKSHYKMETSRKCIFYIFCLSN